MDKPFFVAVAPKAPHVAATPAPWYLTGTFIDALSSPRDPAYNASKELLADHHWLIAQQDIITEKQAQQIDNLFRDRWRSLLSVDDAVVGVMAALDELGVLDNTFMFFTSGAAQCCCPFHRCLVRRVAHNSLPCHHALLRCTDHGYNLGQHRLPSCKLNVCE